MRACESSPFVLHNFGFDPALSGAGSFLLKTVFMKQLSDKNRCFLGIFIHFISWSMVLASPLLFIQQANGSLHYEEYFFHALVPFSLLAIFYLNYFIYIPKILFKEHLGHFLWANIASILLLAFTLRYASNLYFANIAPPKDDHVPPPQYIFFLRDMMSLTFSVCICIAIRVSSRWQEAEAARREAVKSRTEAELKNLRNQLNPHFLLNTLNNIYALVSFDTDKAQQAIQELSKLLRYVLYENQDMYVPLKKEADFIMNYLELMRIRVSSQVEIITDFHINPNSQTPIAPLVFISLIENAFKHGISPTEHSFIHIRLTESENVICFQIANSNHPKSRTDKSGSGIGLEQVSKRLELIYPNSYRWERGISADKKEYLSTITIFLKP